MWAALIAGNLSALRLALTCLDEHGRAHAAPLRHQLLCVPARLIRHGRTLTLRLPHGEQLLPTHPDPRTRHRGLTATRPAPTTRTLQNIVTRRPRGLDDPEPNSPLPLSPSAITVKIHAVLVDPGQTGPGPWELSAARG
jgi:hypothetical protein